MLAWPVIKYCSFCGNRKISVSTIVFSGSCGNIGCL